MKDDATHPDEAVLDRYRSGELEGPARSRVEEHLEECVECAEALAELEGFAATIERGYAAERALGTAREPEWSRQRAAIVERTSGRREQNRFAGLRRWIPQAAAVLVAVIALGVLVEKGVRGPEEAERVRRPGVSRTAEPAPPAESESAEQAPASARKSAPVREGGAPRARDETAPRPPEEDAAAANRDAEVRAERESAPAKEIVPLEAAAEPEPPRIERYRALSRRALGEADSAAARRALALWRDSLATAGLPDSTRLAGEALADSLSALLEPSRP